MTCTCHIAWEEFGAGRRPRRAPQAILSFIISRIDISFCGAGCGLSQSMGTHIAGSIFISYFSVYVMSTKKSLPELHLAFPRALFCKNQPHYP
jgi:hypothetical protein